MEILEAHPLANEYEMMSDLDLEEMVDGMLRTGYDRNQPLLVWNGFLLDGRNRQKAAKKAEEKILADPAAYPAGWLQRVQPSYVEFVGDEQAAAAKVEQLNDLRRHSSPEAVEARRQKRRERVWQLREQGLPTRKIAEVVGTSQTSVRRDLGMGNDSGMSGEPRGSPDKSGRKTSKEEAPVDEREPGDDTEVVKRTRAMDRSQLDAFTWQGWNKTLGELIRKVDQMARLYGIRPRDLDTKEPAAEGILRLLRDVDTAIHAWDDSLQKRKGKR